MDYKNVLDKQLATDFSCTVGEIQSEYNVFTKKAYNANRRVFNGDDCLMRILVINNKIVVSAEDEILPWAKETLKDASGAWFFEIENLFQINTYLNSIGHKIEDCHHFYIPLDDRIPKKRDDVALQWFEQQDILKFRGDGRFYNAYMFLEESPDMLGVCAKKENQILAMAGASKDCETMWQIGIDVLEEGKHLGLGTYLTTSIKNEILKRGILPFYGTAHSHIQSQRVAIKSGFIPAWAELYTSKL